MKWQWRRRRMWGWSLLPLGVLVALVAWALIGAGQRTRINSLPASSSKAPPSTTTAPPTTAPPTTTSVTSPPTTAASTTTSVTSPPTTAAPAGAAVLAAPNAVALAVAPALPGEGHWQAAGPTVGGVAGMYQSQFRPDSLYPYQAASAVWIDPLLLRVTLVPGLSEPGGNWPQPAEVAPAQFASIAAAFNGGFRVQDAEGGFYLNGRIAIPLRTGAASLVLYANGSLNIGAWGSEVTMTPDVVAVLQNLVPLLDGGQVAVTATYYDDRTWGATLGGGAAVARSGIGVTASGALIYVAGPALSARTLAESLERAGAVRAMALDMNPEWVTFNVFDHPSASDPSNLLATKLYPQMVRPATRYLAPAEDARDFFTVMLPS